MQKMFRASFRLNPNIVRIEKSSGEWLITPISKNEIRIEYVLQVDPGGDLPAWLINPFASKGLVETFKNLRKQLTKPQYVAARPRLSLINVPNRLSNVSFSVFVFIYFVQITFYMNKIFFRYLLFFLRSVSAQKVNPVIKNFGAVYDVANATEKPDPKMKYKILVDITDAADKPDSLNAYLEAAATLYNLHAVGGVPAKNIDMVVVFHKMATYSIFTNERFQKKYKTDNPNLAIDNGAE
jgi:hypothetical protein